MATDYFTSKWVMTLYSNFLPHSLIPTVYDNIFLDSWSAVYKIAIALLKDMETVFLQMDMVEMSIYLRDSVRTQEIKPFDLLRVAQRITIEEDHLKYFQDEFKIKQAELKLRLCSYSEEDKIEAKKHAQNILEKTEPHVRNDILRYKSKIEEIEKKMQAADKLLLPATLQYEEALEMWTQSREKKKILSATFDHLKEEQKNKKKKPLEKLGNALKPKNLLKRGFKKTGSGNVDELLTAPKPQKKEKRSRSVQRAKKKLDKVQAQEDLNAMEQKLDLLNEDFELTEEDYYHKKERYDSILIEYEALSNQKEGTIAQMCGFLQMYEMKRKETLITLNEKLGNEPIRDPDQEM